MCADDADYGEKKRATETYCVDGLEMPPPKKTQKPDGYNSQSVSAKNIPKRKKNNSTQHKNISKLNKHQRVP